jgi:hypothetical protein
VALAVLLRVELAVILVSSVAFVKAETLDEIFNLFNISTEAFDTTVMFADADWLLLIVLLDSYFTLS